MVGHPPAPRTNPGGQLFLKEKPTRSGNELAFAVPKGKPLVDEGRLMDGPNKLM